MYDSHTQYVNLAQGSAKNRFGVLTNLGSLGEHPTNSHFRTGPFALQTILTAASIC